MDANGNLRAEYAYDAFGNTVAQTGDMADVFHFRFSTKYYDVETGLYYYGYRFHSPVLGRWLSRDPIEELGGVNLYGFIENTPINLWDVLGKNRYITWFDIFDIGGSGGTQLHVGVAVDTWACGSEGKWKNTGQVTFDFSIDWEIGCWNLIKGVVWLGKGKIVESSGLMLEKPITIKSCPSQDRKMLEMIRDEAKHPPFYNGAFHQCVFWSVGALQYGMGQKCSECCQ